MIRLRHKQTLEFYDVPQIFVATDAMGVNYLCVLYSQDGAYRYLGVQVSKLKLQTYLAGQLDLRNAYTSPEQANALYEVTVSDGKIEAARLLQPQDITEGMLPAPGYYHDPEDALSEDATDTMQLCIPAEDRNFLAEIAHRMGWTASSIKRSVRKIAVL